MPASTSNITTNCKIAYSRAAGETLIWHGTPLLSHRATLSKVSASGADFAGDYSLSEYAHKRSCAQNRQRKARLYIAVNCLNVGTDLIACLSATQKLRKARTNF